MKAPNAAIFGDEVDLCFGQRGGCDPAFNDSGLDAGVEPIHRLCFITAER